MSWDIEAPNVVTEARFRELVERGYSAEILCQEPAHQKGPSYYGVWIMRVRRPDVPRGFTVPALPVVSTLGILTCGAMIYGLGWTNWRKSPTTSGNGKVRKMPVRSGTSADSQRIQSMSIGSISAPPSSLFAIRKAACQIGFGSIVIAISGRRGEASK